MKGDILLDRPGELYVGSLLISDKHNLKFGYNVKPEFISLERDRQTVSDWDLRCLTRDMWYESKRHDEVAQMIYDDVPDLYYARYSSPELIKAALMELFDKRHPGALLAESPSELKRMIEKGMVNTVYVGSTTHGVIGDYAPMVSRRNESIRVQTPTEFLTSWANANLSDGTALKKHFDEQVLTVARGWINQRT